MSATLNPRWCSQMQRNHEPKDLIYKSKLIGGGMHCRHCQQRVKTEVGK